MFGLQVSGAEQRALEAQYAFRSAEERREAPKGSRLYMGAIRKI